MIICIIAGGSGTRLWPLSTPAYPKHLLRVNGSKRSLLQSTFDRAKQLADDVYIITESGHAHHIIEQLPELPEGNFVIEPARRGTASCIIAALSRIQEKHGEDEPIAFLHADHFIRDLVGFKHSLEVAETASRDSQKIVLVGVEPDSPATGLGYIQKGKMYGKEPLVYEVDSFKEKPDYETALTYLKSGAYLWNCGYFVGSVSTFIANMEQCAPEMLASFNALSAASEDEYEETYLQFEDLAIDYALIEKVTDLLVVPANFDWMDLGSYADMHKAVGADKDGNYVGKGDVELESVENSYIENHEDKPIAVIGLDNIVVINTKDGILVARKDLGQKVGVVAKRIAKKNG